MFGAFQFGEPYFGQGVPTTSGAAPAAPAPAGGARLRYRDIESPGRATFRGEEAISEAGTLTATGGANITVTGEQTNSAHSTIWARGEANIIISGAESQTGSGDILPKGIRNPTDEEFAVLLMAL